MPLHTFPQPPQLSDEVKRLVSHPLVTLLSQLAMLVSQLIVQAPAMHDGAPPELEQTWAQEPQCAASALRLTSQPLEASPSQFA